MRSPFKSWDKSDSQLCDPYNYYLGSEYCKSCNFKWTNECDDPFIYCGFVLGNKDKQLLLNLCKAGDPSHRKVLRQLPVMFDITAPLYFFKQFDTYKVGTTANSTSTMHQLTKYPFKGKDFSLYELDDTDYYIESGWLGIEINNYVSTTLELLNALRDRYIETREKKYWNAINRLLPQSYNQTRTWSGNYEVLLNMIQQRRGHKLTEWQTFSEHMLEHVPYLKEIYEAVNESKKDKEKIQIRSNFKAEP